VVPVNVPTRLSGYVYRDQNNNGSLDGLDSGIRDVTLTLTGTSASGASITRTVTTDANGFYTFLVPASNAAGYTITQTEPALYQDRAVNVGTLGGTANQVAGGNDFISGIVANGTNGTGYNFGETNVAPVVSVGADLTATFCGVYNFTRSGFFTDAAQDGAWTGTVDYGDGSGPRALALSASNTFQLSHTYTRAGLYNVVVTIRDSFGQSTVSEFLIGANRPLPRAYGSLVTVNDGAAQRSMVSSLTVTFNETMLIDPGAFQVQNAAGTVTYGTRTVTRVIGGKTVVVLEFTDNLAGGSLADGNYRVRIDGSKVRSLANAVWNSGAMYTQSFFRFFGDSDGDRDVDDVDLNAIRAALRSTRGAAAYREHFDYDSDCDVDATDYNQFLARYRRSMPA
jgi:hypothetical protein